MCLSLLSNYLWTVSAIWWEWQALNMMISGIFLYSDKMFIRFFIDTLSSIPIFVRSWVSMTNSGNNSVWFIIPWQEKWSIFTPLLRAICKFLTVATFISIFALRFTLLLSYVTIFLLSTFFIFFEFLPKKRLLEPWLVYS